MQSYQNVKWVEWVEPINGKSDPVFCRVRPEVAIQCSKEAAAKTGHVYESDQDAFEDFVVVHWALIKSKPFWQRRESYMGIE